MRVVTQSRPAQAGGATAVVFDHEHDGIVVVITSPQGNYQIMRYSTNDRAPEIRSESARTLTSRWSAFTTPLEVPGVESDQDDEAIMRALLSVLRNDPDQVLPPNTNLQQTAIDWCRSSEEGLTITKADFTCVSDSVNYCRNWLETGAGAPASIDDAGSPWDIPVETPTRALVRFWLLHVADRSGDRFTRARDAAVAFLSVDSDGFAIALWSARTGLIHETEERLRRQGDVAYIVDRLAGLITPSSLSDLNLQASSISTVVVSSSADVSGLGERLRSRLHGIDITWVNEIMLPGAGDDVSVDHMTALAIGTALDDPRIPHVDLADDIESRLERIQEGQQQAQHRRLKAKSQKAGLLLVAPIIVMLGIMLTWYIDARRETADIQAQIQAANREAARLANEAQLRKSYEERSKYYMGLTEKILDLRGRQPAMLRLMLDLNERWPRDPTLSMLQLRTTAGGAVELKGKTRQQDSVTQLATSLEFGGGRFVDIQPESRAEIPGLQSGSFTQPGAPVFGAGPPPVIAFTIKATYVPLAQALAAPKPPPPVAVPPKVPGGSN